MQRAAKALCLSIVFIHHSHHHHRHHHQVTWEHKKENALMLVRASQKVILRVKVILHKAPQEFFVQLKRSERLFPLHR